MENWLLLAAAILAACAAAASFMPWPGRRLFTTITWCVAATIVISGLGLMVCHLLGGRFEYCYVYNHTERGLCALYRVSALWSGQEGSLLLWAAVMAATGFAPMLSKSEQSHRAFGVYASIAACLFGICFATQPFSKMSYVPPDGLGLPVALQDPWMVAHPPLVFAAYSAMAVLAAQAAGLPGATDTTPFFSFRKWVLISWLLLGLGIFTGCIWAYRALGWGGYWSWDPIENAAIVPWLVLGGYLHSVGKPGKAKCILPFTLACLGTFLARSGILADRSAHAYASGNVFASAAYLTAILAILCFFVFCAIKKIAGGRKGHPSNGQGTRLGTGVPVLEWVFYLCAALILAGTIAPLILDFDTPKMYFDIVAITFSLVCMVLLLLRDREALKRFNLPLMVLAAVLTLGALFIAGNASLIWALLLWVCLMPVALWVVSGFKVKTQNWKHILFHSGAMLLIAGAIVSSGLGKNSYAVLKPDGSITIGAATIRQIDMEGRDTVVTGSFAGDVLIECAGVFQLPGGGAAVPYSTRPLIILFWAGGFGTVLGPCITVIMSKRRKTPSS